MMKYGTVYRSRYALWIAGAMLAITCLPASGEDLYVTRDGRKIKLTRSETEYGVSLHRCDDADECARRLASRHPGQLKSFEHAPTARVKLLEVPKTTPQLRKQLREDPAVEDVRPVYRFDGSDSAVIGTGTAVVRFRPGLSDRERVTLWKEFKVAMATRVPGLADAYLLTPSEENAEIRLAEQLAADPRVRWAHPNFRRPTRTRQVTPVDPFYSRQWHLNNTGQLGGAVDADIDAVEAWNFGTGDGVLFGIFDTGCDVDHEDLRDNYLGFGHDANLETGVEGSDDPRPKVIGDSHSTAVMGLAVAAGNTLGGRGVAFDAQFTASRGLEEFLSDVEIARAYNFARENGVDVHINSWGFFNVPDPDVIVDIIDLAFREGRNKGDIDGDGVDDPLGMVILFAAGNDGVELEPGLELSMLPQVIGVGGTGDQDELVCYSSYGSGIDVLAPTGGCFEESAWLLTTDNTDSPEAIEPGYNIGGFYTGTNVRDADTAGKYSQYFGGTSASCPVAAGVAGLMLSVNPMLTATDVRLILEHTADKVSPDDAEYHGVTGRSLRYAHGRINAGGAGGEKLGAVEAAEETLTNGGITWPDRPADVRVEGAFFRWRQNYGTSDFLVLRSTEEFEFIPQDGACYDSRQENCSDVLSVPGGVEVIGVGCNLSCDPVVPGQCSIGAEQCVSVATPEVGQTNYYAIYARNILGRYSFGVLADSTGNVLDAGIVVGENPGGGQSGPPPAQGPAVTIGVSPLEGISPLTVHFSGNAVSISPIDESRTIWDFNVEDATPVDATTRNATHTYTVANGVTQTFIARLTMYDIEGNAGFAEAGIRVEGQEVDDEPPAQNTDIRIIVSLAGTPGSDVGEGTSPFSVSLSLEAPNLQGTLQGVSWDLGDGTRAASLVVPHTYVNEGDVDLRIPITATATAITAGGTAIASSTTRIITVHPGPDIVDPGDPDLPGTDPHGDGGAATPCSGIGMIPLLALFLGLSLLRRSERRHHAS